MVDKTGLTGNYDFSLKWTPDQGSMPLAGPGRGATAQGDAPVDPNGPTLFTALEEQLGLKLQSEKGTVDVIVIDHIDLRHRQTDASPNGDPVVIDHERSSSLDLPAEW